MKIGYFADGPWSHKALDKLLADKTILISFICARFDKPDPVLRSLAAAANIPFFVEKNINSDKFLDTISDFTVDIHVSMSFNQIFRQKLINQPSLGTINCHAGKLPYYRGRNILNWALINDEKEFGITVHYMDKGIDTGDIITQSLLPIDDQDTYKTLLVRAYEGCANILYESLKKIQSGTARRIKQQSIHPMGFYCTARGPGDEVLDWNQSSRSIFNFVRAICPPGPAARTVLKDREIKINHIALLPNALKHKGICGAVLEVDDDGWIVKTADSYVKVTDWEADLKICVGDRLK
ncbi:MAG: formyl transferase [Porticoccus sp.]|nr:formyl transferase [Porticoccus sp.]